MHDSTIGSLPESAEILKRIVMRFDVLPRRIGEVVAPKIAAAIDAGVDAVIEQDQLPGIANRQRLQHDCVDQREDRGIRPDAERQRQNRRRDEDWRPAKLPGSVSHVLNQRFEPYERGSFGNFHAIATRVVLTILIQISHCDGILIVLCSLHFAKSTGN